MAAQYSMGPPGARHTKIHLVNRYGFVYSMRLVISGETGRCHAAGAEGATAPETLRQKDRFHIHTLKSRRHSRPAHRRSKHRAAVWRGHAKSLRSSTEGVSLRSRAGTHFDFWREILQWT